MKKKKNSKYLSFIDSLGFEHSCNIYTKVRKKINFTTDTKLTLLLALWILDKIIVTALLLIIK
tara:strand:- start:85 stop:273 length:189 start_codon:yes stop_codon:yes gene_type:complete